MKTIDLVVIGGGPGGYSAAFRAADLGMKVMLVERFPRLGGVCLNVGCIPSKTLLHAAGLIEDAAEWRDRGVVFDPPRIDLDALRDWKEKGVTQLADGLGALAKRREVEVVTGRGEFVSAHTLAVETDGGREEIRFSQAVIATGSHRSNSICFRTMHESWTPRPPWISRKSRSAYWWSGAAYWVWNLPRYSVPLGSQVTVVEALEQMMGEADKDVVRAYLKRNTKRFAALHTGTQVQKAEAKDDGILVQFEGSDRQWEESFDAVLVAVGRAANSENLGLENAGVAVGGSGAIPVNYQQRTNIPHIFAIGDVTGGPMLAHRASYQGRLGGGSRGRHEIRLRGESGSLGGLHRSGSRLGRID